MDLVISLLQCISNIPSVLRGKIFLKDNILFVNKYKTEGAGILSSTIWANGLIRLKSNQKEVKTNDYVEFYPYESFT